MFTDRFMSLPIQVYDTKEAELTGKEDFKESTCKINPMQICEYYQSWDGDTEGTQLYFNNGRSFIVYVTIDEFEKLLNSWQKTNQ